MSPQKLLFLCSVLAVFNGRAQAIHHATTFQTRIKSSLPTNPFKTGFIPLDRSQNLTRKNNVLRKYDQEYLLNYQDSNLYLGLTPLMHFSGGKDFNHTGRLFQNTRGALFSAKTKKFQCYALICENQARFSTYETQFIKGHGEFYPTMNGYQQQNGFIPGAARTKPFGTQAFDYMYTRGEMTYSPNGFLTVIGGNGSLFLGDGYRALALSDAVNFPHVGFQLQLSKRFQLLTLRGALYDLIRKPTFSGVESNYYSKAYSLQMLTFQTPKTSLGLFYQNIWSMGSVVLNQPVSPLFWFPVPGLDRIQIANASKPMIGLTFNTSITKSISVYGQGVSRGFSPKGQGIQLGLKFNAITRPLLTFSMASEFNYTGESFYGDSFDLAFSHTNLPLGSVLGNGTKEGVFVMMLHYRRWTLTHFFHVYRVGGAVQILLIPSYSQNFQTISQNVIEIGYVINQMSNLQFFGSFGYRNASVTGSNSLLNFGLKTKLFEPHNAY